jgi:hypothetical protein
MSSRYTGYKTYAARESTLTREPGVTRQTHDTKFHAHAHVGAVPDAAQRGKTLYEAATTTVHKGDYHPPVKQ